MAVLPDTAYCGIGMAVAKILECLINGLIFPGTYPKQLMHIFVGDSKNKIPLFRYLYHHYSLTMFRIYASVLALCIAAAAHAQDSLWTLQRTVKYAVDNNIDIKQSVLMCRYQVLGTDKAIFVIFLF